MKRFLISSILLVSIFLFLFLHSCKKSGDPNDSRDPNDLFPLKLGNEFYFKYQKKVLQGWFDETNGLETWVVENVLIQDQTISYIIKRRLNALRAYYDYRHGTTPDTIKTLIADSSYFLVEEDKKTSIISSTFSGSYGTLSMVRYQNETQDERTFSDSQTSPQQRWTYLFKADSGLVYYYYYHRPMQVSHITLILDSLKLNNRK